MFIIPAIDLKDGKCVRLKQGKKELVTIYSNDPVEVAKKWVLEGATLIHIVDLDGAFSGTQKNIEIIHSIRNTVDAVLQVGGGIRSMDRIKLLLEYIGIDRVILGTSAVENPTFVMQAADKYPDKILIGIDARDGKIAVKGWQKVTEIDALKFAKNVQEMGIAGIIYTDITRDGMLTGPNYNAIEKMVNTLKIDVIASGGVCCIEDIKRLKKIKKLWGIIIGKALYSNVLNLKEAMVIINTI